MFGLLYGVTSVDVSFVDCFLGCLICASSKVFIGIGLLTTPAKVDCPFWTDFQVGAMVFYISDVFFLLDCFGNGAVFSKVEDHSLLDDADFLIDVYCLDVWAVFFSGISSFQLVLPFSFLGTLVIAICLVSPPQWTFSAVLMLCRPWTLDVVARLVLRV